MGDQGDVSWKSRTVMTGTNPDETLDRAPVRRLTGRTE